MRNIPPNQEKRGQATIGGHAGPARAQILWHTLGPDDALGELSVDRSTGLSEAEVSRRRAHYGPNVLATGGRKNPWLILWQQISATMVVILILAAAISALLGDYRDALAILAIVILNAALGFSEEFRAEKALLALEKMSVPTVRVRRAGRAIEIASAEVVPGDIVSLEAGNFVAADGRILGLANLQTQEAALTGESQPVDKVTAALAGENLAPGDRRNMVYMGTFITAGRGEAVVTETGMRTELGRIAGMIGSVRRERTPLEKRLDQLGKSLAMAALSIVALVFVLGWIRGESLGLLFLTAVSLAVAAVPEGLPAVVTIALTLGAQRLLRRRALVRKLAAVETLGSVTVICSDKTGTLTENRMTVTVLCLADGQLEIPDSGRGKKAPSGGEEITPYRLLLAGGALCNDAVPGSPLEGGESAVLGDPTETALLAAASRFGLEKRELEARLPRVAEVPFSAERKRMTTVHKIPSDLPGAPSEIQMAMEGSRPASMAFTKGGVEILLDLCSRIWVQGKSEAMNRSWRDRLVECNDALAAKGMRILGVAFRSLEAVPLVAEETTLERNLTFLGLIGMMDPPRSEAAEAVARCKTAGIRPVMITGDHPLTARSIAAQLGINGTGAVLTGAELERLSSAEWEGVAESVSVYARVSPQHKLKIVEGLERRGQIVAMTGDGVNDAPALKKANIGVSMGITGTEVAKEAADMVLLDDNFSTIVAAVEEGRVIYDNIRKFVKYILATNSGEIWTMIIAPLSGMPLPLLPLQILWMNLVTDGLPALALGVEPPEGDTMRRPPFPPRENIFARGMGRHIVWVGLLMGVLSFGIGYAYWRASNPAWQTVLFTTLTLSQMANVLAIRTERSSVFTAGFFSNRALLGAVTLTVLLQAALIYVPFLQEIFKTEALSLSELLLSVGLSCVIFLAVECEKWVLRRLGRAG